MSKADGVLMLFFATTITMSIFIVGHLLSEENKTILTEISKLQIKKEK